MYTLDLSFSQLDRMQDRIAAGLPLRIIHTVCSSSDGFATYWEDRYIVIIDCDPREFLILLLL